MPYIPKKHEKYALLPHCRAHGGEVFDYPSELLQDIERMISPEDGLIPYGYRSYEEYFAFLDNLIVSYEENTIVRKKLLEFKKAMYRMNRKEEWSVLKYVGESFDTFLGLTQGKNYYWPTSVEHPVFCGVIDNEEFTAYLYDTDASLWEILEDPTGMAKRTLDGGERI